jgi:hypothetical protein
VSGRTNLMGLFLLQTMQLIEQGKNQTQTQVSKEVHELIEKEFHQFEKLLKSLNEKYFIFHEGWRYEIVNGNLAVDEWFIDLDQFPDIKKTPDYIFERLRMQKGFIDYRFLKKIADCIENPRVKKQPPTIKTYLMTDFRGCIKIGKTTDVYKRFLSIRTGNPTLKIIASLEKDIETELLLKFKDKKVLGEWFSLDKEELHNLMKDFQFPEYNYKMI